MKTSNVTLLLVILVLSLLLPKATVTTNAQITPTDSHGRRWSRIIEPPAPDPDWNKLREQQLTTAQLLNEIGVTAEYKVTGSKEAGGLVELLPEEMQISGAWLDDDRFKLELGTALPKAPGAARAAMAKLALEFKADAPTISEVGFEGPVSASTKITSSVKYDQIHDPHWAIGVEIQKLFAKFKGEIADGAVNRNIEISLVNVFNAARGIATPGDLPRDLILKVDTVKFYNAIVQAAKQAVRTPGAGSKYVKGLLIRFNPVLMVAALKNDQSLLKVRNVAVALQQTLARQFPKGVKIQFNDELLGEMLRRAKGLPSLSVLAGEVESAQTSADAETKIARYSEALTLAYRSSRPRQAPRQLVLLSLKRLVTDAERYRDRWAALPQQLLKPGMIGRIVGYRVDNERGDVYLIGIPSEPAAALSLEEMITGLTAAFVNNESPFCSLDPDPSNLGGVQTIRVGGVPVNSRFARTMLDADYLMKKINAGVVKANSAAYKSFDAILSERSDRYEHVNVVSRFWFYPTPSRPGDIELSSDGTIVFFASGIQVLSEQMIRSRDGLVGTGASDSIANELAVGFTKALPEMATQFPDIARLHGLFDLVLLGQLWRQMAVKSEWLDRLITLPTTTLDERTYEGVTTKVYAGTTSELDLYLKGGVRLRPAASGRAMLVIDDRAQNIVRGSLPKSDGSIATQIDFTASLPAPALSTESNIDAAVITAMIARGEFDRASVEIQRLLSVDPLNPEAWCLKAENDLQRSRFVSAIHNAERALELAPDDPENQVRASVDLFSAYFMLGEAEHALDAIRRAAQFVPDSLQARLFYADALASLGRFDEARKEYRSIQRTFPYSPDALIRFGVFEISEGNVMSGKQLIDRATNLSSSDIDRSAAEAALALAETGMAILDSPEDHLNKAETLAGKVLANKAASPLSRLRALSARSIVALARDNVAEAEVIAEEVLRITPANPAVLLSIAEWAHYSDKPEMAARYLARAEKIAPNMPLVKAVAQKIRGGK